MLLEFLDALILNEIDKKKIDFVIVNGENAAAQGVGLNVRIFYCGVDVIVRNRRLGSKKK